MPFHNPVNYARGLLVELDGAERAGRTETAADIRAQFPDLVAALDAVNTQGLEASDAAVLVETRQQISALASEAPGAEGKKAPRTTAAPAATSKAVPPAAK